MMPEILDLAMDTLQPDEPDSGTGRRTSQTIGEWLPFLLSPHPSLAIDSVGEWCWENRQEEPGFKEMQVGGSRESRKRSQDQQLEGNENISQHFKAGCPIQTTIFKLSLNTLRTCCTCFNANTYD